MSVFFAIHQIKKEAGLAERMAKEKRPGFYYECPAGGTCSTPVTCYARNNMGCGYRVLPLGEVARRLACRETEQ